jgi:hypothetical protein
MYYFRVKCLPFLTRKNKITFTLVLCKYLPNSLTLFPKYSAELYYIKRKGGQNWSSNFKLCLTICCLTDW